MSSCPLCDRKFGSSLSNEFLIHVNSCLDIQEQSVVVPKNYHVQDEAKLHPLIKKQRERQQASDCVVCGKIKATAAHIKKCGKQYGVDTNQLIKLVADNEPVENPNLQNIVFKDSNLNKDQIVNKLFTEKDRFENDQSMDTSFQNSTFTTEPNNPLVSQSKYFLDSTNKQISSNTNQQNDFTIVLDKSNESNKNNAQTKLKVIRKSKLSKTANSLPHGFDQDQPLHESKRKRTVKIKRNPLVKVGDLDDKIIQNFRDQFESEKEPPLSWKLANLTYDSSSYIVDGFDEFCKSFDFKARMNGFEIGLEKKL